MAANLLCTGPVYCYARIPSVGAGPRGPAQGGTIQFIGTAQEQPRIGVEPKYKQIFNDLGGDEVAFDAMFTGEEGSVEIDFNRFDMTVMQQLSNVPRYGRPGTTARGTTTRLDRGSMALANKLTWEMWLSFSFYNTINAVDYPELIPGFYFPSVVSVGTSPSQIGTRDTMVRLMVKPMNWWNAATGQFMLYSNDPVYFQPLANVALS